MSQKPSDTIVFPLSDLDRGITDILPTMSDASRWPAFNAVRHLNRAWKLSEIDPQMAMFRAITAEEEAATAVFLSLKRRGYRGAEKLKHRDHVQKNALIPFFDAIRRVVAQFGAQIPETEFLLNSEEKRMEIRFKHIQPKAAGDVDIWAYPTPPLHFSLSGGPVTGKMKKEDFSAGVQAIIDETNVKDIIDFIRSRANFRNQILYAGPDGYPNVSQNIEEAIKFYQRQVFVILRMYMLIDPYQGDQLFVQQALDAFLKTLRVMPRDLSEAMD